MTQFTQSQRRFIGFKGLTSDPKWANGVLVEGETLFQSMSSHILIEDITSGEVQNSTVVLVLGN